MTGVCEAGLPGSQRREGCNCGVLTGANRQVVGSYPGILSVLEESVSLRWSWGPCLQQAASLTAQVAGLCFPPGEQVSLDFHERIPWGLRSLAWFWFNGSFHGCCNSHLLGHNPSKLSGFSHTPERF